MTCSLQAAGLPRTTPRKDWPLPLLKQILTDSMQETPRQLLARELWCGSGSASEWWSFQAGYTSSTAAMSMVGFAPDADCASLIVLLLACAVLGVVLMVVGLSADVPGSVPHFKQRLLRDHPVLFICCAFDNRLTSNQDMALPTQPLEAYAAAVSWSGV